MNQVAENPRMDATLVSSNLAFECKANIVCAERTGQIIQFGFFRGWKGSRHDDELKNWSYVIRGIVSDRQTESNSMQCWMYKIDKASSTMRSIAGVSTDADVSRVIESASAKRAKLSTT